MNYKILIVINSSIAILSGLLCLLLPATLLANYDVALSSMGLIIYQFWGVSLIGLGIITWMVSFIEETKHRQRITITLFIINILNTYLAYTGQFNGANTFGWSTVIMFGLLSFGFMIYIINNFESNKT